MWYGGRREYESKYPSRSKRCYCYLCMWSNISNKINKRKIDVEICSECHPFYTGTQGKTKKTGNIEKFNKKFGLDKEQN